jgi:lambda repressor-like predicted transcriptional regulator
MIVCKLSDILEERGMSKRELARRSGLNINTLTSPISDFCLYSCGFLVHPL